MLVIQRRTKKLAPLRRQVHFRISIQLTITQYDKHVLHLQAMEDKQHHEVEHVNEERILEDTTMIDSSELKSDVTHVEVDMAGSKEGTLNQHATDVEVGMAGSKEGT